MSEDYLAASFVTESRLVQQQVCVLLVYTFTAHAAPEAGLVVLDVLLLSAPAELWLS